MDLIGSRRRKVGGGGLRELALLRRHFPGLITFSVLLLFVIAFTPARTEGPAESAGFDCFTVAVGRNASADGAVMVAHNEDDRGDILVNVRKIAPGDYGPSRRVDLGRGAVHETAGRTAGFLWIEATTQEFADSFVNEHGILITSDSCSSKETAEDLTDGGIGYMLRRLLAEQARSAREAVRLAGGLVEKYGYRASGRTYTIADRTEAWLLSLIRGKHWYAQRVPDDEIAVIPNHYTIRVIRPEDPDHFMGSADIVEYAASKGWYDAAAGGPFDFKQAFARPGRPDPTADGNALRHWRGLNLLGDGSWEPGDDFPFSVKSRAKVTVEALMAVLRDHYEGTPYDATDGYKTGTPNRTRFRTICTASTINSFVAVLDAKRPEPLSIGLWLAFGKPDTTVFLPLYYGAGALPPGIGTGRTTHDDAVLYKQHFEDAELKAAGAQLLNTRVLALERVAEADYGPMREVLRRDLFPIEQEILKEHWAIEAGFAARQAKDAEAALRELEAFMTGAFARVTAAYEKLLNSHAGS